MCCMWSEPRVDHTMPYNLHKLGLHMTNIDLRTEQTVALVVPHGHDVEAGGGVAQECCLRAGR